MVKTLIKTCSSSVLAVCLYVAIAQPTAATNTTATNTTAIHTEATYTERSSSQRLSRALRDRRVTAQRRRRPRPPRNVPPNRVQPGGGLDIAVQACDPNSLPLTAILPKPNPVLTVSEYPTFLFYLPDSPDKVSHAEFILLTADEKEEIYSTEFKPTASGVVSISLPAEPRYALENDQIYHWYLNLYCQPDSVDARQAENRQAENRQAENRQNNASIPAVNGWVKKAAAGNVRELDENGLPAIWYDAIAQLAADLASEQSNPQQAQQQAQQWSTWLTAIGLSEIADPSVVRPSAPQ